MSIYKISKYVVLVSFISIMSKPSQAFWPVLDFGEIVPIQSNVTTAIDTVSQAKSQLTELTDNLSAISKNIKTIAAFSQDIKKTVKDAADQATGSLKFVNTNTGLNIEIPQIVNSNLKDIDGKFTIALNDITSETYSILSDKNEIVDEAVSTAENIQIEEEEEEEEIKEEESLKKKQDEIVKKLEEFQKECDQVMVQMNDVLDASINTLNNAAEKTKETMQSLKKTITLVEDADQASKDRVISQIEALMQKQEAMSDTAIEAMEQIKENYNKEYQRKLIEGIDNYKKEVMRYFNGDASTDDIKRAGETLKEDISKINIKIDTKTLENIQKETEEIKASMQEIVKEVESMKK